MGLRLFRRLRLVVGLNVLAQAFQLGGQSQDGIREALQVLLVLEAGAWVARLGIWV